MNNFPQITHGFDDSGRRFDAKGNLVDWWQQETKDTYLKKAECIIYQYGNYTEPATNKSLNAKLTLGENIAVSLVMAAFVPMTLALFLHKWPRFCLGQTLSTIESMNLSINSLDSMVSSVLPCQK